MLATISILLLSVGPCSEVERTINDAVLCKLRFRFISQLVPKQKSQRLGKLEYEVSGAVS
jgi:hypothetical protein